MLSSIDQIGEEFGRLNRAAIDACSIIYLIKTGVFDSLAAILPLVTTEDVFKETQWPRLPVQILPSPEKARSHDHGLFLLARTEGIPLISDDFEVLNMADKAGMVYYNTLMMLNYLCFRKKISPGEYPVYRDRLLREAHYGRKIIEKGEEYFRALCPEPL